MSYKSVSIYVALNNDLHIFANGIHPNWGATIDIEVYYFLSSEFTDEMLETIVIQAFHNWNSVPNDNLGPTMIERVLKVKGYLKAVKHMKLVSAQWNSDEGFSVTPKENRGKNGFVFIDEENINLGSTLSAGILAQAIRNAISISK